MDTISRDVAALIFSQLSAKEIARLSQVSQRLLIRCTENDVWRRLYERAGFPKYTGGWRPLWKALFVEQHYQVQYIFNHTREPEEKATYVEAVFEKPPNEGSIEWALVRVKRVMMPGKHRLNADEVFCFKPSSAFYLDAAAKKTSVVIKITSVFPEKDPKNPYDGFAVYRGQLWPNKMVAPFDAITHIQDRHYRVSCALGQVAEAVDIFSRFGAQLYDTASGARPVVTCDECRKPIVREDRYFCVRPPSVADCLADGHCTLLATGSSQHAVQPWFRCMGCNLVAANGGRGCCGTCAAVCHKGHTLVREADARATCDCSEASTCLVPHEKKPEAIVCPSCAAVVCLRERLREVDYQFPPISPDAQSQFARFILDFVRTRVLAPLGREMRQEQMTSSSSDRYEFQFVGEKMRNLPQLVPTVESNAKYLRDINAPVLGATLVINFSGLRLRSWALRGPLIEAWTATQVKYDSAEVIAVAYRDLELHFSGLERSRLREERTANTMSGQDHTAYTGLEVGLGYDDPNNGHWLRFEKRYMLKQTGIAPHCVFAYQNCMM